MASDLLGGTASTKKTRSVALPPILSRLDRHCEAAIAHEHQKYSAKEFPVGGTADYTDHSEVYRCRPDAVCEHMIGILK